MLILPIDQILISEQRQRRTFEPSALQELAESIERNGLLQALVVRQDSENAFFLVCGERRLRAIRDYLLPFGTAVRYAKGVCPDGNVPCIDIGDLDPLAAEEAELEENIRRVDLSWQERATATARLAKLRSDQSVLVGGVQPTIASLAIELYDSDSGSQQSQVRREIIVSKHLGNPAVAAAKNLDDAWKTLKREEETQRNVELSARVGRTFSANLHSIHQTDALEWLAGCLAEQFDVILTDPPYGMGADEFGDSGGKVPVGQHGYEDSPENWNSLIQALAGCSFRITKPQAHLYCFCDIDKFQQAKVLFALAGWTVFRTPLIWHKPNGNRAPWPDKGPHRKYELILYAIKGGKPVTKLYPDVLSYPSDDNLGWNAQKPVALFEDLLKRSVRAGDSVLDCFCGTGTIFPAANALKCIATGVEQDPAAYGIALGRLQKLKEGT